MISIRKNSSNAREKSFFLFQKKCDTEISRLKKEKDDVIKKKEEETSRAKEEEREAVEKEINDSKSNYSTSTIIYLIKELVIYSAQFAEVLSYLKKILSSPQSLKTLAQRVGIELAENSFKSLPLLSVIIGFGLCINRVCRGEFGRGVAELGIGVAGCFPGPGTFVSIMGSIALIITDLYFQKKK